MKQLFVVPPEQGQTMYQWATQLFPICRSITGAGVLETLQFIAKQLPSLQIHEVASRTQVLDWEVPNEWHIRDAYIKNSSGEKIVDFKDNNLHVVNYSAPIHTTLSLAELKPHLFSLPSQPDVIPYRTTYYDEAWGFCLTHKQLESLPEDRYEVVIESELKPGVLRYGEVIIPGETKDEVLISTHICHPSMANDNLSGIVVATALAELLQRTTPKFSYRFLFIPGTIGSLTWLASHKDTVEHIKAGLVLTGVGDSGAPTYKLSRQGDSLSDLAMEFVLKSTREDFELRDFSPYGYDERQYCSLGFNLPIGCLMRTPHGEYPEYHTSADNLSFIKPDKLHDTLELCAEWIQVIETNRTYQNLQPYGEPQLGKRGLYQAMGQQNQDKKQLQMAMLWILNYSDSQHSLLEIAILSGLPWQTVISAAELLRSHSLLKEV